VTVSAPISAGNEPIAMQPVPASTSMCSAEPPS